MDHVVKSEGFWIYKDINKISNDKDKDIIRKKSRTPFGKGIIIIASIETNNATTIKSFENIFLKFIYYLLFYLSI